MYYFTPFFNNSSNNDTIDVKNISGSFSEISKKTRSFVKRISKKSFSDSIACFYWHLIGYCVLLFIIRKCFLSRNAVFKIKDNIISYV